MNREPVSGALRRALNARCPGWARTLLAVLATAVFALLAHAARYAKIDDYASFRYDEILMTTTVVFTALFAVSAAIQMRAARKLPLGALLLLRRAVGDAGNLTGRSRQRRRRQDYCQGNGGDGG